MSFCPINVKTQDGFCGVMKELLARITIFTSNDLSNLLLDRGRSFVVRQEVSLTD